ncbi:MAG TPA: SusC/RagA family TonB-linked outer membrane protein [Gemmatimonadales bacterium]|nr:SusC/RagA family TonB-linked outer membrane protein [Gemmatimonadales bacterium]
MALFVRRVLAAAGLVAFLPARAPAQEPVTITGTVTTDAGVPLALVEVSVPSLGVGALTRDDGRYTILVPGARVTAQPVTLTARRLGFKAQSAQISLVTGGVTQDFVLAANPLQLGEIVVTGAGTATETQKLGNVRNAVSADLIERSNEWNVVEALAAKAPNVNVTASSGEPGSGSYISIRGQRTVGLPNSGSAQPLFVVDGVPIDNSSFSTTDFNPTDGLTAGSVEGTTQANRAADLNPNDIESVEILKGAAAAAIYGARAGQGVVLITTKRGTAGPTRYSFRSSISVDDINRTYPLQRSWGQGSLGGPPGNCDRAAGRGNFFCRTSWGPRIAAGAASYDHANEAYVTGYKSDNSATVSGGNDRTTFYLSGGYLYNRGIFAGPNNSNERVTVRFNGSHRITDQLKLGANFSYVDARGRYIERGNNTNGLQLALLRSPPDWNNLPYLAANGQHQSFRFKNPLPQDQNEDRGWENPFFVLHEPENTSQLGRVFGNVTAEFAPASWIKVNYILGADYSNDERLEGAPQSSTAPQTGGRVTEGKLINYQIDHNLSATAYYTVNPNFGGSVTIGQNLNSRNVRQLSNVGRTLIAPLPYKLSNTVTRDIPIDGETVIHGEAYFGQATVDLYNQLYLTGALRNDGSSTFDQSHLRSWFPKASAAWEFTKAIGERPILTYGKARVSYGEAGQEPDPYLTSTIFSGAALIGGYTQGMGSTPTQGGFGGLASSIVKGASTLRPERTKEFETGVDLGVLRDKADLSLTFYNATTSDVILLTPLSPSSGYEREARNSAKFRNRGYEVSLNVRPIRTTTLAWDVGLQWASNRSKVLSLGGPEFVRLDPNGLTPFAVVLEGAEIGVFHDLGLARCGLSPGGMNAVVTGYDLDPNAAPGPTAPCAGAPRGAYFIGVNGEPVVDNTLRVIGNPNPRWTGSVRSSIKFRKFQLSGLLDIKHGGQMYNGTKAALYSYGTHRDTETRADCSSGVTCTGNLHAIGDADSPIEGPVVGPGAHTPIPIGQNWYEGAVIGTGIGGLFGGTSEQFIEDAGFVKLREITVGYTFDQAWVQRTLGFNSIDVRVSGRNLKTWTKYTGYDPETNLGGSVQSTRGMDYFNMPQTRSFVFSLTLNR